MSNIYVYGVIDSREGVPVAPTGANSPCPLYTVAHQTLGCVVGDYAGVEFGNLSKEELVRRLLAHQEVVERVMQQQTVLPVKFGTTFGNSQEALSMLSQGNSKLTDALDSIRGKVEIEIAATWDTNRALQVVGKEPEVVHARESIARVGRSTVEERVHLGQIVKAHLDKLRAGYQERMVSFLKPFSVDMATNALLSDEMVMNVAFLVDKSRQCQFDEGLEQLDRLFQNEIDFRMIGPLPLYSFSTVEVQRLSLEQIEEARRTLHLGSILAEIEVRKAYRRLAAEAQRNLRLENNITNDRPSQLREATELLLRYCRARKEAQREEMCPGLIGQDSDPLFDITLRRTSDGEVHAIRFSDPEWV